MHGLGQMALKPRRGQGVDDEGLDVDAALAQGPRAGMGAFRTQFTEAIPLQHTRAIRTGRFATRVVKARRAHIEAVLQD